MSCCDRTRCIACPHKDPMDLSRSLDDQKEDPRFRPTGCRSVASCSPERHLDAHPRVLKRDHKPTPHLQAIKPGASHDEEEMSCQRSAEDLASYASPVRKVTRFVRVSSSTALRLASVTQDALRSRHRYLQLFAFIARGRDHPTMSAQLSKSRAMPHIPRVGVLGGIPALLISIDSDPTVRNRAFR